MRWPWWPQIGVTLDMVTTVSTLSSGWGRPTVSAAAGAPARTVKVVAEELDGDRPIRWQIDDAGSVTTSDSAGQEKNALRRAGRWFRDSMIPENYKTACSSDYMSTRMWTLLGDYAGSMAGMAAVGCVFGSVASATDALAAFGVMAINYANMLNLKDRVGQITGFLATPLAMRAERNPRPWLMAGDTTSQLCSVLDASVAIAPPIAYFPILIATTTMRSLAGAVTGGASANIGPRQAINGNLGEISVKNGNQGKVVGMAGALTTPFMVGGLSSYFGATGEVVTAALAGDPTATATLAHATSMAGVTTVAIGAGIAIFSMFMFLRKLDLNPVNEHSLRRVLEHADGNNGEIPGPNRNVMSQFGQIGRGESLTMGDRARPILEDPALDELRQLYKDRPYIMQFNQGQPYTIMTNDERYADHKKAVDSEELPHTADFLNRMAQTQAAIQALRAEKLVESPEYAARVSSDGQARADRWLLEESLKRTPDDIEPFLVSLKARGWSVDLLKMRGRERPTIIRDQTA